ncbi:MAG: AraC family transcriptional regulator [Devosia sp.]|nr:AraC family transcriptional regulator [Devosia sp.]
MSDTVATVFARRAIDLVRDEPERFSAILADAGVCAEVLDCSGERIPARCFGHIWDAVSKAIDDEFFHVDTRRMKRGSFAFLCQGLVNEPTLGAALRRCLKGFSLFLDDISAEVVLSGGQAAIRVDTRRMTPANRVFATELLITKIYGVMCWLAERRLPLNRVDFEYAQPAYAAEYRHWLSDALSFDADATEVWFDAKWLDGPVIATAATMNAFLTSWPQSVFVKYRSSRGWASRVRGVLKSTPYADWPDVNELAQQMSMAPSTLQRRLGAEGTSYSVVKAEVRRDIAVRLLKTSDMAIQDVAIAAGYREVSAFYRAFRQWTGRAPGHYRVDLRAF